MAVVDAELADARERTLDGAQRQRRVDDELVDRPVDLGVEALARHQRVDHVVLVEPVGGDGMAQQQQVAAERGAAPGRSSGWS